MLESELSGAVPRQAGTFDVAAVVQADLDVQDSNDRAAKTVYTELTIVRQWLNFAVTRRMLTASPVAGTKPWQPKNGEERAVPTRSRARWYASSTVRVDRRRCRLARAARGRVSQGGPLATASSTQGTLKT